MRNYKSKLSKKENKNLCSFLEELHKQPEFDSFIPYADLFNGKTVKFGRNLSYSLITGEELKLYTNPENKPIYEDLGVVLIVEGSKFSDNSFVIDLKTLNGFERERNHSLINLSEIEKINLYEIIKSYTGEDADINIFKNYGQIHVNDYKFLLESTNVKELVYKRAKESKIDLDLIKDVLSSYMVNDYYNTLTIVNKKTDICYKVMLESKGSFDLFINGFLYFAENFYEPEEEIIDDSENEEKVETEKFEGAYLDMNSIKKDFEKKYVEDLFDGFELYDEENETLDEFDFDALQEKLDKLDEDDYDELEDDYEDEGDELDDLSDSKLEKYSKEEFDRVYRMYQEYKLTEEQFEQLLNCEKVFLEDKEVTLVVDHVNYLVYLVYLAVWKPEFKENYDLLKSYIIKNLDAYSSFFVAGAYDKGHENLLNNHIDLRNGKSLNEYFDHLLETAKKESKSVYDKFYEKYVK